MSRHGGWWVVDLVSDDMRVATRKDFADDGWTQTDPGELAAECRRLADENSRLRDALETLDSGAHAPEGGPEAWQEYAMYVQVVAGSALGTVG